jgi:hypothetical protein
MLVKYCIAVGWEYEVAVNILCCTRYWFLTWIGNKIHEDLLFVEEEMEAHLLTSFHLCRRTNLARVVTHPTFVWEALGSNLDLFVCYFGLAFSWNSWVCPQNSRNSTPYNLTTNSFPKLTIYYSPYHTKF